MKYANESNYKQMASASECLDLIASVLALFICTVQLVLIYVDPWARIRGGNGKLWACIFEWTEEAEFKAD